MFILLTRDEIYRSQSFKEGEVIEVGSALGDMMILNGHKKASSFEDAKKNALLSDDEIDTMEYQNMKSLLEELGIETVDNKKATYIAALKEHFALLRG